MIKENKDQQTFTDFIIKTILTISPHDILEQEHINDTLTWIRSGASLFRTIKPDTPNKHLVSYFILFDEQAQKILLVDHKKAQLWLPPGGHLELNEDPKNAVKRECLEELHIEAEFWNKKPLFLTSTVTVGLTAGHTDISLWYVLKGHHQRDYTFDDQEFHQIGWFDLNNLPYEKSDPHLKRFLSKLKTTYIQSTHP